MIALASALGMPIISVTNPMNISKLVSLILDKVLRNRTTRSGVLLSGITSHDADMSPKRGNSSENAHTRVKENRLPPSDGVGTDQWVLRDDRFTSHGTTKCNGPISLNLCRVQSLEAFEIFLHAWRQKIIHSILGSPECIPTSTTWRASQDLK